jgi:hypothetical protein
MKQQDKLSNTLRDYYDNKETPFNDNEWERASAFLNKARRKRKIRVFAIILVALFSTLFVTLFNFQKLNNDESYSSTSTTIKTLKPVVSTKAEQPLIPASSDSKIKTAQTKKTEQPTSIKITKQKNHLNIPKAKTTVPSTKLEQTIKSNTIEPKLNSSSQPTLVSNEKLIHNDNNATVTPTTIENAIANRDTKKEEDKLEVPTDAKEIAELTPEVKEPLHNQDPVEEGTLSVLPTDESVKPETVVENKVDSKQEVASTESIALTSPEEKTASQFVDTFVHNEVDTILAKTSSFEDTLSDASAFNILAGEGVFYEVGAVGYYGWKSSENRDARGASPLLGINYMNQLNNNSSLSFGVQYLQVTKLSHSSKTSRISTYEYGEQSQVTVVTPSTMHYLVAPLRYHYYLNKRNSFGAGINLAYLLNIDAKVTTYDEKLGVKSNSKTIKLSGYTEGFSWFDSQLAFFYRRKIGNSFGLQAELFLGLTDVKQDEFFGLNYKERNSGIKLSLIYFAFRKKDKQ